MPNVENQGRPLKVPSINPNRPLHGEQYLPTITRLAQPTPEEVKQAREAARLTQGECSRLTGTGGKGAYRTWLRFELAEDHQDHRKIPIGQWEHFLLLTGLHPSLKLTQRNDIDAAVTEGE